MSGGVPGAVLAGVRAALVSPRWIERERLQELMRAPAQAPAERPVPRGGTGAAFRLLRVLQHLPGQRWRNTCLYRSVAECLVLRRYGVPAVLKIGVRNDTGDIQAHAWVVRADRDPGPDASGHQPLVIRA